DTDHPDKLIVDGVFAFSRNPIYVAFVMVLIGEFLIFPYWISLIYLVAAAGLIHRQVLREEDYLKGHYGEAYAQYCHRVRRYLWAVYYPITGIAVCLRARRERPRRRCAADKRDELATPHCYPLKGLAR